MTEKKIVFNNPCKSIIVLSILFSLMTIMGTLCCNVSINESTIGSVAHNYIVCGLLLLMLLLFFYYVLVLLYCVIDLYHCSNNDCLLTVSDNKLCVFDVKVWIKYFLIITICWTPYLIICYPAVTRGYDYFWQLLQGLGIFPLSNHHPVLSSYLFGVLFSIGHKIDGAEGGFFFTMIIQLIAMAGAISFCLTGLSKLHVNKKILMLICLFLSLCPVFPTHAIWLIKDSIFTSVCVFLFFQIYIYIWSIIHGLIPPKVASLPCITIMCVLFSLLRNGVFVIALILLLTLVFVNKLNNPDKKATKKCIISLFLCIVAIFSWNSLLSQLDVFPTNVRESLSMPLRQIVRSIQLNPSDVNNEENEVLKKVYKDTIKGNDIMEVVRQYQDLSADPIKASFINDKKVLLSLAKIWAERGITHIGSYLDATVRGTYGYWWLQTSPEMKIVSTEMTGAEYDFAYEKMNEKKLSELFIPTVKSLKKNGVDTTQTFERLQKKYPVLKEIMTTKSAFLKERICVSSYLNTLKGKPIISVFFTPGSYLWIMLISLGYMISRKREGRFLWPILLLVVLACLSPINGYTRYVLPVEIMAIIMIGICFIPSCKKRRIIDCK